MAINPFRKGGNDTIPIPDGGTGAVDAATALSNLGGLDTPAHAAIDHTGLPGVGGALTLIEKKEIFAAVTTVTFSGLDGNTDGIYVLESRVKPVSGLITLSLLPNGLTTNQSGNIGFLGSSYIAGAVAKLPLGQCAGAAGTVGECVSSVRLYASAIGAGALPQRRRLMGNMQYTSTYAVLSGLWIDTSTNITSLVIEGHLPNEIDIGSTFALYKLDI